MLMAILYTLAAWLFCGSISVLSVYLYFKKQGWGWDKDDWFNATILCCAGLIGLIAVLISIGFDNAD